MIPWIYLSYNEDFNEDPTSQIGGANTTPTNASAAGDASATADKSKKASASFNSSKVGAVGTSTNVNKSNFGPVNANDANQYNSGINESGLDIENEFGYATDEDSIFAEFF